MITYEQANKVLSYNPNTGILVWKLKTGNRSRIGQIAGCLDNKGYQTITLFYGIYGAHRLAWLLTHKQWPKEDIDHINGVRNDNRLSNLCEATRQQNCMNRKLAKGRKFKGVYPARTTYGWDAIITFSGKRIVLGTYSSPELAAIAYENKAKELYGEFYKPTLASSEAK